MKIEILDSCPLCGSDRLALWRRGQDRLYLTTSERFVFSRCIRCGVRFMSRRPMETDAHLLYPKNYGPYRATEHEGSVRSETRLSDPAAFRNPLSRAARRWQANPIPQALLDVYLPHARGEKVLDLGAGSPLFLDWARAQGWLTMGMDVFPATIAAIQHNGHEALLLDDTSWNQIPDGSLSLVRMNHVIEHSYDPVDLLRRVLRKIRAEGRIHIATPNPLSASARLFRSFWWSLEPGRHIFLLPPKVLEGMLQVVGFRNITIQHEIITKDAARSLGLVLRAIRWMPHEDVSGMDRRALLNRVLLVPALIAARSGISDRYHCIAET